jgi:hypothetical protein
MLAVKDQIFLYCCDVLNLVKFSSTVTVKKIKVDKNCAFQCQWAAENALSLFVLNGLLCAQFVMTMSNSSVSGTVSLAAAFLCGIGMGFNINTRGDMKVSFLIFSQKL